VSRDRTFPPECVLITLKGHKYGLVTPGIGWVVWRDESYLPKHLIFELHYLGGKELSFTLNFSRPGAQVIVQYYNLIHLGFAGYREIMENCLANARLLSKSLEATGWYICLSDIHRPAAPANGSKFAAGATEVKKTIKDTISTAADTPSANDSGETSANYIAGLPVVSFRFTDEFQREFPHVKQETVSLLLRARQWIIPNYALPPSEEATEILRVVVRESMSFDLLDRLVTDIVQVTSTLMENDEVDLSILHKQKKGPARKEKNEKKEESSGEMIRKGAKRMTEGIHRSVC